VRSPAPYFTPIVSRKKLSAPRLDMT